MATDTRARAVVLRQFNTPLGLETAPTPEPEPGAVVAQVDLAGVCGTDVHLHHGHLAIPLPVILGHEGVGRVARLVVIGVAIGLAASLALSPIVQTMLYQLQPRDPATMAGAAGMLTIVGLLAGWLPARRAARIDPAQVLREG